MMVYDVSLQKLMIYDSTFNGFAGTWQVYQTTDKTWNTVGNQGTNYTSEFIGTTDDVALSFRVNNLQSGLIDQHTKTTKLGYATGLFGSNSVSIGDHAGAGATFIATLADIGCKGKDAETRRTFVGELAAQNLPPPYPKKSRAPAI